MAATEAYLDAPDWEATLKVVERNPVLRDDIADELLSKSIIIALWGGQKINVHIDPSD